MGTALMIELGEAPRVSRGGDGHAVVASMRSIAAMTAAATCAGVAVASTATADVGSQRMK